MNVAAWLRDLDLERYVSAFRGVNEAAANMAIGVSQAGCSLGEKFPIFLLIFLSSAVALFVKWKFL